MSEDPGRENRDRMNAERGHVTLIFRSGHTESYRAAIDAAESAYARFVTGDEAIRTATNLEGTRFAYRMSEVAAMRVSIQPLLTRENDPQGR